MYREARLEGRGLGCVARRDIQAGEVLVSEEVGLAIGGRRGAGAVLEAFLTMGRDQQEEYLHLANKYEEEESLWSEHTRRMLAERQVEVEGLHLDQEGQDLANKVWQIFETNSFPNGVFLKVARFNHSCRPNAEFRWDQRAGRREVRAVRGVRGGEEVTISYSRWGCTTL